MSGAVQGRQEVNRPNRQDDSKACLRYISQEQCLETRGVWEEVFSEDSQIFTEYYYRVKAPANEGFVLEGSDGIRAMLFLTPEKMQIHETQVQSAYIVGVATRQQYRHRGYMACLLRESFQMLRQRKVPFVFLMPASAAIYEPFGFRFIYDRPIWDAETLQMEKLQQLGEESIGLMADFSNKWLASENGVYICRDEVYDKVMLEELQAQNGCVLGYVGEDAKLQGLCLYTCEEGEADIQEVLADPEAESCFVQRTPETKPCIMGRILHLPALLELLRSANGETICFGLQVEDTQIPENNGLFVCTADKDSCSVSREVDQTESSFLWKGTAAELIQQIFAYKAEEQKPGEELWKHLRLLTPVWINEIV